MTWIDELSSQGPLSGANLSDRVLMVISDEDVKRDQGVVLVLWSIRCVRTGPKVETMQQNLEDTNKDFQEPTTISKQ